MTMLRRTVTQRPIASRVITGTSHTRQPTLVDRQRVVLAAVDAHNGSCSAAGRHLGMSANAVRNALARAGANLGTDARGAVKAARKAGLLDGAPTVLPAATEKTRETFPRPGGTVWTAGRDSTGPHTWMEGVNMLVLRTGRVEKAREVAAARWEGIHGRPVPVAGVVVWRRQEAIPNHAGGQRFEPCDPYAPRAFPAVLFTPEGA